MAYDARRKDVVLFGGLAQGSTTYGDTWTWDGREWTQRTSATQPPARFGASMVYDGARGVDTTSPYGPSALPFAGELAGLIPGGL